MSVSPATSPLRLFLRRFAVALTVLVVGTASAFAYANWFIEDRWGSTDKVVLPSLQGNGEVVEGGSDSGRRDFDPAKPANYLIIGSDSRSFADEEGEQTAFGDPETQSGQRSDTIMVAHVDPNDERHGYLVSFPRDLWVDIPGKGNSRINSAFNEGPDLVVQTLKENFGIDIQYYLEVDFQGFKDIVDAIGYVEIYFPTGARDTYSNLDIPYPGCWRLPGELALAYARSRHYEYKESADSDWKSDPTSDFGRIRRQQYFIRSLFSQAVDRAGADFRRAMRIVDDVVPNIARSSNLGVPEIKRLVNTFRNVDPGSVEMVTLPADGETLSDGAQVLIPNMSAAAPILDRLKTFAPAKEQGSTPKTTVPRTPASEISVLVQNGSGQPGIAGTTLDELTAKGFVAAGAAQDADSKDYDKTVLRHAPGQEGDALVVRAYLGGVGVLEEVDGLTSADVVLVIGDDFGGTTDRGVVPSTTTSSTVTTLPPNPGTAAIDPFRPGGDAGPEDEPWIGCPPGSDAIYAE